MSEWISIKNKIPEKDARYLVVENHHSCIWIGVCSWRNNKFDSSAVTYWQPLPDAPKDKE